MIAPQWYLFYSNLHTHTHKNIIIFISKQRANLKETLNRFQIRFHFLKTQKTTTTTTADAFHWIPQDHLQANTTSEREKSANFKLTTLPVREDNVPRKRSSLFPSKLCSAAAVGLNKGNDWQTHFTMLRLKSLARGAPFSVSALGQGWRKLGWNWKEMNERFCCSCCFCYVVISSF